MNTLLETNSTSYAEFEKIMKELGKIITMEHKENWDEFLKIHWNSLEIIGVEYNLLFPVTKSLKK